jgi:hypothetical protein
MAHARMPRGNATAWVSKPRHRSPPIRPGDTHSRFGPWLHDTPLRQHIEGLSHQSARQKGRRPADKPPDNRCLPPPAPVSTFRPGREYPQGPEAARPNRNSRLGKPSRVQTHINKKSKNTLFPSDTTDPNGANLRRFWDR